MKGIILPSTYFNEKETHIVLEKYLFMYNMGILTTFFNIPKSYKKVYEIGIWIKIERGRRGERYW